MHEIRGIPTLVWRAGLIAVMVAVFLNGLRMNKLERKIDKTMGAIVLSSAYSHRHGTDGSVYWEWGYPYCDDDTSLGQICRKFGEEGIYIKTPKGLLTCNAACFEKIY